MVSTLATRRKAPVRRYKKRGGYRGARRMMRMRSQPKVYYYKQAYYKTSAFQLTDTSDLLSTLSFTLNGAGGNVPAFTQIYDQYSIRKIVVKFIPKFNSMESNVSSSVNFCSVIDFDDSNPLGSINEAWQYQSCKMTRGTSIHTRIFKPSANAIFDGTTTAAGLAPKKSPWLDCSNIQVPHYGLKLAVPQLPSGASPLDFDLQATFYLAFKNVR